MKSLIETLVFRTSRGLTSRCRVFAYRVLGMTIGDRCRFEKVRVRRPSQIRIGSDNALSEGTWLWPIDASYDGARIEIGNFNYFNRGAMLDACGSIKIGDHVMIGPNCYITDSNHTTEPGRWVAQCPMDVGAVTIGDGCWIGCNVTILKDVTLGPHCIVAAGAVVTKSFPGRSVIGGVPARLLKQN